MFFVCLSRFGITKFVITVLLTETLGRLKQCYFQNSYGVIACRKVCSCCAPIFNFFCGPPEFSIMGKFFAIWGAVNGKPTFLQPQRWNFAWGCRPGTPSPKPIFFKNRLRGFCPFGQIHTKNTNFGDFGGCIPTFLTHSDEIWHEGANVRLSPQIKFCKKKSFKGYTPFGQIYTKNYKFRRFWRL